MVSWHSASLSPTSIDIPPHPHTHSIIGIGSLKTIFPTFHHKQKSVSNESSIVMSTVKQAFTRRHRRNKLSQENIGENIYDLGVSSLKPDAHKINGP